MSRVADPRARITLLRAAEEVFAERGVAAAKVEDIAKRAGLSKGAFYLHFESKEALLKQIVESFLARCGTHFASPSDYPELPDDPDAFLDFGIERDTQVFEFLWQHRATLRILQTCQGQGEYEYLVQAFRSEIDTRTHAWVDHFRRLGLYRAEVDPELAATLMGGSYAELSSRMLRSDRQPPFEEWLRFAQETFVRAYGSPEFIEVLERRNHRVTTSIGARRSPRSSSRGRG